MGVVTRFTVKEIQQLIYNSELVNKRNDIVVPNLSWSILPYEADLVVVNKSGYMTEFEIKRSYEDLVADFKKDHRHDAELVYRFYYVLPIAIEERAMALLHKMYEGTRLPAVLFYDENGLFKKSGGISENRGKHRKLFIEEQLHVARMGTMRFWKEVNKIEI